MAHFVAAKKFRKHVGSWLGEHSVLYRRLEMIRIAVGNETVEMYKKMCLRMLTTALRVRF